jgi:2-oxoglutarate dehydrogenase E2 component (dihydrolipoamide succinyltransferase)
VLRDAGALNLAGVKGRLGDLADRALSGQLGESDLTATGFMLMLEPGHDILVDIPVLAERQFAVLSPGTPVLRPVVVADERGEPVIAIRSMAWLAFTYDYRLVRKPDIVAFLASLKAKLEAGRFR